VLTRFEVAGLDAAAELELLVGRQERYLVDFLEVSFEAAFSGNGSAPDGGIGGAGAGRRELAREKPIVRASKRS